MIEVVFQCMSLEPLPKAASVGLNEEQTAMLLDEHIIQHRA